MRTSDRILRQVRRALIAAFVLAGFSSLLIAALALHALPLLPRDLSLPQPEQLWLLTASAAAAALVLLCVDAARERIVQRAGLWIDHTLGQHLLVSGARQGTPANALKGDAAAVARVRDALLERAVMPALEAPWALIFLAVLALLHPLLAALAAISAAVLLLAAVAQAMPVARLEQQRLRAAERVAVWWRGLAATLPPDAARHWERLNRPHVAAAYALDRRVLLLRDLARVLRAVSLLAMIAVGVWLVGRGELTLGALVAAVLLHARLLAPFAGLLAVLKTLRRAMLDYRRLASRPTDRPLAYATYPAADALHMPMPAFTAPIPRLHIGGPLMLGLGAAVLFLAAGLGAAALLPPQQIASLASQARFAADAVAVRHARGGVAARLHVARGAQVQAGDLLVSLDTTVLDRQIAALRSDADAARRQLETLTRDAVAVASLVPATLADRAKLRALEEQLADLQRRVDTLPARIAAAELDLARSVIRAPVAGRVIALNVRGPNDTIAPGGTVAEIVTAEQSNLLDGLVDGLAEPLLRKVHRVLRSLYQENAA